MRRPLIFLLAGALILAAATARAQRGDLSGVTMRVLDDVSEIDAVILELDASRGEDEGARDEAESDTAPVVEAGEQGADEPREREALHDPDDDERSEGKLEDNDVERPAVPLVP
jgi:hypothetical protein